MLEWARSPRCHGALGVPQHLHPRRSGRASRGAGRGRLALGRPHAGQGPQLTLNCPTTDSNWLHPTTPLLLSLLQHSLLLTTAHTLFSLYRAPTPHPPKPQNTTQVLFVLTGDISTRVAYLDNLEDALGMYNYTGSGPSDFSGAGMFSEYSPGEPVALKEASTSLPVQRSSVPPPPRTSIHTRSPTHIPP